MRLKKTYIIARHRAARWASNESGVAATEFALILPLMLILLLGTLVAADAYSASRKVSNVVSTMSDVVAQYQTITKAELQSLMSTSKTLMQPYTDTGLDIKITSVLQNSDDDTVVMWSIDKTGGTPYPADTPFTIPAGLTSTLTSIVVAEVSYAHTALIKSAWTTKMPDLFTFSEKFYSRPRQTLTVECSDCDD